MGVWEKIPRERFFSGWLLFIGCCLPRSITLDHITCVYHTMINSHRSLWMDLQAWLSNRIYQHHKNQDDYQEEASLFRRVEGFTESWTSPRAGSEDESSVDPCDQVVLDHQPYSQQKLVLFQYLPAYKEVMLLTTTTMTTEQPDFALVNSAYHSHVSTGVLPILHDYRTTNTTGTKKEPPLHSSTSITPHNNIIAQSQMIDYLWKDNGDSQTNHTQISLILIQRLNEILLSRTDDNPRTHSYSWGYRMWLYQQHVEQKHRTANQEAQHIYQFFQHQIIMAKDHPSSAKSNNPPTLVDILLVDHVLRAILNTENDTQVVPPLELQNYAQNFFQQHALSKMSPENLQAWYDNPFLRSSTNVVPGTFLVRNSRTAQRPRAFRTTTWHRWRLGGSYFDPTTTHDKQGEDRTSPEMEQKRLYQKEDQIWMATTFGTLTCTAIVWGILMNHYRNSTT